jgi:hypothetical protein
MLRKDVVKGRLLAGSAPHLGGVRTRHLHREEPQGLLLTSQPADWSPITRLISLFLLPGAPSVFVLPVFASIVPVVTSPLHAAPVHKPPCVYAPCMRYLLVVRFFFKVTRLFVFVCNQHTLRMRTGLSFHSPGVLRTRTLSFPVLSVYSTVHTHVLYNFGPRFPRIISTPKVSFAILRKAEWMSALFFPKSSTK